MTKIAFIGVRNMGAPMANNLIKAGHQLCVYDVMPVCMKALPAAKAAASALHSKTVTVGLISRALSIW